MPDKLKIEVDGVQIEPVNVDRLIFTQQHIINTYGVGSVNHNTLTDEERNALLAARQVLGFLGVTFDG